MERGLAVVPIPEGRKRPIVPAWQALRIRPAELDDYRKRGKKARHFSGWDEFPHTDSRFCAKFKSMRKTFRFRLYPTPAQQRKMVQTLRECRGLYNTLLAERRDAYTETGKSPSLYTQQGRFPELKEMNPALREVHSQVLQNVAVRIDLAFKAFFRRVKAGEKPGYPRFRGANRYDSFTYPQSGFRVESGRVFLSKIGFVGAVIHRPIEGTIKTTTVRKSATGKWFVCFSCEVSEATEPLPESMESVGVDVGLKDIIATSDGEGVPAPKFLRKEEKELARTQRRLSEAPKGSRECRERRKIVAKVHERIKNKRTNFAHQQSRRLVNRYGFIAVEDLSVNRMNKNHCLAKSIMDAAWTDLTGKLTYKAEWAGRTVVRVNPAYTTQDCSCCGHRQLMPLSKRVYDCPHCGLSVDRDTNAAKNILRLGLQSQRRQAPRSPLL
jgi:putative transposase